MIPSNLTVLRENVRENGYYYWLIIWHSDLCQVGIYIEIKISIRKHPQFIILKLMASNSNRTTGHNI